MVGFSASHSLNKSWEVNSSIQTLFYQNLSELWIANADLGIVYNVNNHWKTELHVRAIKFRSLMNDYENRSLYFHTLTYSDSWKNFGLSIRHRTQQLVYGDHWNDAFKGPVWYLRDRVTLKYKVNYYWTPFVACETFVPLNHSRREGIDQWRFSLGVVRTFSDRFRMDFRYQLQQPTQRLVRSTNFLANINCYFKF
ncbi:MAG: DUF2490 domain-containing protein [Flavobacteriales bacterium]